MNFSRPCEYSVQMRLVRFVPAAVVACALLAPASASADHHLISVREVFPGSTANGGQDYVELQMYSANQDVLSGHQLTFYSAAGSQAGTVTFPSPDMVSNGQNQRTVLIGAS